MTEPHQVGRFEEASVHPYGLIIAREDHFQRVDFSAFNYKSSLPRMRRWEMPYAIFESHLSNESTVLDLTINPAGFEKKLRLLFPKIDYRHRSVVQNQKFYLPEDQPDDAFDHVICINTLEHLLREQRTTLIQFIAQKLKPGGMFILTFDYYFDHSWQQPAFLKAGVMREDRQEIFNGWNKLTIGEVLFECEAQGLNTLGPILKDPSAKETGLYLNLPPYEHATVGAKLYKPPLAASSVGKKIMLALLTWNTRQISLESASALLREARLLRGLGEKPYLCICDNGSQDGTPQALQAWKAEVDLPFYSIFNPQNRGNSIARNQIIDVFLREGIDYLLFMDGDIEIIPFSSFALLRYAESQGQNFGCIGLDPAGYTQERSQATPFIYSVYEMKIQETNLLAWTQYGLFTRQVFASGVRFDEHEPFDRPGWGLEDNDLAFQMAVKGFKNHYFSGAKYLHRNAHSSVPLLQQENINIKAMHDLRRAYVVQKWKDTPLISQGPLKIIRSFKLNF
jgi:GT2 family glycosyltransferase